jgi:hypothetical protein
VAKTTKITGVKETIRALNKIEPGLRKEFTAEAKKVAAPAIQEAQRAYTRVPLSGMNRNWQQNSRRIFPFTVVGARRGVKLKVDAARKAVAVILIQQTDRGAAVFESAGRGSSNPLGKALGNIQPGQTRIIGPAVYRRRREVAAEMKKLIAGYERRVQRELN